MSDTTNDASPEAIAAEITPSGPGQISGLASANAPTVIFDATPFFGAHDGIGSVTLTARRHINAAGLDVVTDRVIVGHLKGGIQAMRALRQNLDAVIGIMEEHQRLMVAGARAYDVISQAIGPEPSPLKN